MFPDLICKLASVCDPFVYGLSNRQFKHELVKKLTTFCRKMSFFFKRILPDHPQDCTNTEENADYREKCETSFVIKVVKCVPRSIGSSEEDQGPDRVVCHPLIEEFQ
ncbi:hypothetical protein NPIL_311131 [Nephila pilipes]|uniref:Uncharacterized protein n=1 Tax=Nephila pilipes TaxID=299642 RepID=A0A8X6NR30_NEPPI|nr:hypothetical protein NPIL_311131 [Nephila pilipes]